MADWFLWFKAGHIISVVAWMAGLFYLPRLFVYHCRYEPGTKGYLTFCEMERKLSRAIMAPAAVGSWLFGGLAAVSSGYFSMMPTWLTVKLVLVGLLSGYHVWLLVFRNGFAEGNNQKTDKFYRAINEIPTVLLVGIVILVVVRPFG